jgi:hypothetical protein
MSTEGLAAKISGETPWWATAPIWLAAGIVGVPSLIAVGAGYFVAHYVTTELNQLSTFGQSQLYLINEHINESKRNWGIILKFIDDDLKVQYQTCINSGHTPQERAACLTPGVREEHYGIGAKKK